MTHVQAASRPDDVRPGRPWRNRWAVLLVSALALGSVGSASGYADTRHLTARQRALLIDPSGESMPVGDLSGWRQVFRDDFGTDVPLGSFPDAVHKKWFAYAEGWRDTSKNGTYSPRRVISVRDGVLDLHLRTVGGVHLVAAPGPRLNGPGPQGGLRYGRFAVRYRADPIPGYKVAWLLWPDSEKWSDGEIDFPEGELGGSAWAFMHHRGAPMHQDWFATVALLRQWHTAVIEWTPSRVRFLLDGVVVGVSKDRDRIPREPMHWVLQTETVLGGLRPPPAASGHVTIDWVAVYRRK